MNGAEQSPLIERVEMDELVCWRVRTSSAELLVAQQGAQVLSYQRDGEPPLIWLSEQAEFKHGQSVRGGVPVCWPWFGDLKRNPQAIQAMHEGGRQYHPGHHVLPWRREDPSRWTRDDPFRDPGIPRTQISTAPGIMLPGKASYLP